MKILSILLLSTQLGSSAGQVPSPVAKTRTLDLYTFQGCYEDRSVRAMPQRINGYVPLEDCMEGCRALGFHYFAQQYYTACFCSGRDKNDRGFAVYGKKSSGCFCDSKSFVGNWANCVYRIWPQQISGYLPETACMTPASSDAGAEIDVAYCGGGGTNVYYYTNNNEVKHASDLCVEMKITDGKMKLVLENCNGKDNQKFEVMNDCSNGVCGNAIGTGFSAECEEGKDSCENAKIWNYDVNEPFAHINVASCKEVQALDSSAENGQYNFDGHNGDYTFCDYNNDRRIRTQKNGNYCLNWYGYGQPRLRPCTSYTGYQKHAIRSNGIVKPYGINIDQCYYVDTYNKNAPVKLGPCLNIDHGIKFEWYIDNFGQIKPKGAPHMCLEIYGGVVSDGAAIVLFNCAGGLHQRWGF